MKKFRYYKPVIYPMLVALLTCVMTRVTLYAQGYPCFATITATANTTSVVNWDGAVGTYVWDVIGSYDFTCGNGQISNCSACCRIGFLHGNLPGVWTAVNTVYLPSGVQACANNYRFIVRGTMPAAGTGPLIYNEYYAMQFDYAEKSNNALPCSDPSVNYSRTGMYAIRVPGAPPE